MSNVEASGRWLCPHYRNLPEFQFSLFTCVPSVVSLRKSFTTEVTEEHRETHTVI